MKNKNELCAAKSVKPINWDARIVGFILLSDNQVIHISPVRHLNRFGLSRFFCSDLPVIGYAISYAKWFFFSAENKERKKEEKQRNFSF